MPFPIPTLRLLLLLTTLLTSLTTSLPAFQTIPNNPSLHLPPTNAKQPHCATVDNPSFAPPARFLREDCTTAFQRFNEQRIAGQTDADSKREFVNATTKPFRGIPWLNTPYKFTSGSCTVAIVMREDFRGGELPEDGGGAQTFASSDLSSWRRLYATAGLVEEECHGGSGARGGWLSDGDLKSIVVGVWPTQSPIDNDHVQAVGPVLGAGGGGEGIVMPSNVL